MTITSFSRQLVVITSKQRPRKLTIHGNDGEDYAFLLKGHEDLRQDERVMQVILKIKSQLCGILMCLENSLQLSLRIYTFFTTRSHLSVSSILCFSFLVW